MSQYLNHLVNSTSKIETACREIRECASQLAVENSNSAESKPVSGSLPPEAGIQQLKAEIRAISDIIEVSESGIVTVDFACLKQRLRELSAV
jgi:hypothetical protein